jgi:preprotein translocase subunit SecG
VFSFFIVLHVLICIGLVIVVLMQSAKGEGLAGAFGGGGALSGAVFGGRGAASFLSRATTVLAVLFMLSCIALTFISKGRAGGGIAGQSAVQQAASEAQQQQQQQMPPATPAEGSGSGDQEAAPLFEEEGAGGGQQSGGEQQQEEPAPEGG